MDPQQDYIADISIETPDSFEFSNNIGSPPFPHTPSYNGSYHNSPYSNHSELSFNGEENSFGLFEEERHEPAYDPSEYDPPQSSLLMFNDNDYIQASYDPNQISSVSVDHHRSGSAGVSYDYSSPSSNGGGDSGGEDNNIKQLRSRASSVSSNPHLSHSPRMDVAQSFENLNFRSPNWGTDPLPPGSPHMQKPQSPPRLLMPDTGNNPSPGFAPPTINAPEGDGVGHGPRLHIVPATPVSGGGSVSTSVPFQNSLETLHQGAPLTGGESSQSWKPPQQQQQQQQQDDRYRDQGGSGYDYPAEGLSRTTHPNSGGSPYLFPGGLPRSRSKSDTSLEPPAWGGDGSGAGIGNPYHGAGGSALDDSVSMEHGPPLPLSLPPNGGSPHRSSFGAHNTQPPSLGQFTFGTAPNSDNNGFLSPDSGLGLRRSKSDTGGGGRPTHVRQSRSEDLRPGLFPPGGPADLLQAQTNQFLSPVEPPPSIRGHGRHYRSVSSGGSVRSERGFGLGGDIRGPGGLGGHGGGQWSAASSQRPSPYPSPNVSPSPHYTDLPPSDLDPLTSGLGSTGVGGGSGPIVVSKQNVTTVRTSKASHNRRKQEATFICPVPGCGSTFTRSFNLKGHIRSHNEEKPFLCKWPGCGKGFARQHDCKRHEQLHTNYRPFTCEGCSKQFARMDALNRHLRSEGGAECQRTLEANGRLPDFASGGGGGGGGHPGGGGALGLMPDHGGHGGRARSYSQGSYNGGSPEPPPPPALRMMAKTEDPWANMNGVAL